MDTIYIADKSVKELEQLFRCDVDDDDFYDVIAYNIGQNDPQYLIDNIASFEGKRLRGFLFALGCCPAKDAKLRETISPFLQHSDPLIIADAIEALKDSGNSDLWDTISQFGNHESEYVRGAVLRYAAFALPAKQASAILAEALHEENPIVLQNAIDELGDMGDVEARQHIFPFLNSENDDVREAAKSALNSLR